jgi:hypothetical protein
MAYIDVRGIHPVLISGISAVELRNAPRDITLRGAEMHKLYVIADTATVRDLEDVASEREHLESSIRWWESYRDRNSFTGDEVLDRVGTVNGVLNDLRARLRGIRTH